MSRLTNLIKEVLSTQPKKKDCNCGCNTCENVGNEGVLLNESIAPKQILSENLRYHVQNKLPLTENTFRYGSQSFIDLWAEARALYLREIIHVNDDDKEILEETDLGNYGMYEGKKVPLGLPMENIVNEGKYRIYMNSDVDEPNEINYEEYFGDGDKVAMIKKAKELAKDGTNQYGDPIKIAVTAEDDISDVAWTNKSINEDLSQKLNSELDDINGIFAQENIDVDDAEFYDVKPGNYIKFYIEDVNNSTILKVKRIAKANGLKFVKDLDDMLLFRESINEAAKKKKKNPPLGKPKRGGSKAYYVYVRDPKTKRIKKVSFGSGGLKAKINNPKARQAFAKRHRCSEKKDKTKASYWSCRLPRYAKLLGLKSSFSGFW